MVVSCPIGLIVGTMIMIDHMMWCAPITESRYKTAAVPRDPCMQAFTR
jgi:hypothetical protein